jgi:dimethylargininase
MRVFDFNRAIVRQPSPSVVRGLRAGDHDDPSFDGIVREHGGYVEALRVAGLDVTELAPLPDYPDSIFVEDPALVFTEGAILLRPGTPSRASEAAELSPALGDAFDVVFDLPRGFADGGDVLVTPDKIFVGLSARTDEAGAVALSELLARLGRLT